jgi:hypothetical protein
MLPLSAAKAAARPLRVQQRTIQVVDYLSTFRLPQTFAIWAVTR